MIETIVSSLGLTGLSQILSRAFKQIDHPLTSQAAQALTEVETALQNNTLPIKDREFLQNFLKTETDILAQINQTFQAEIITTDGYVRRWRPTFGYAVAVSWFVVMMAIAYSIIFYPIEAPSVLNAMVNLSALWGIALGVLGISVVKRSQDKKG